MTERDLDILAGVAALAVTSVIHAWVWLLVLRLIGSI